jgi:hypothetical protein
MLKNQNQKINIFLLVLTFILLLLILLIIFFYINEKNVDVQVYLKDIQYKLQKHKKTYSTITNNDKQIEYSNNIVVVKDFLEKDYYLHIRKQFDNQKFESRNFLVRKATGVNFFELHKGKYDGILEIYYSNEILEILGRILKKPLQRISLSDPNACSLLIYTNKGDHIDWHLDYSNYYGDRYVVLLTIVNENESQDDLSDNIFKYDNNGKVNDLKMLENSLIIFKGSEILHKSTAIEENQRRILVSMVFCDICQEKKNVFNIIYEKSKNYILYGE